MDWRTVAWVVLTVAAVSQGWGRWERRAIHPPDGVLAPDEPMQTELHDRPAIVLGRWTLTPRAEYDITARVLGREDYRFDGMAKLAPEDLALGWGPMSDNRLLGSLEITQGARFYTWRSNTPSMAIAPEDVTRHSANTHVIPADARIREKLDRLRSAGQVVHLTGLLVDGVRDDGATIHSSLTRNDSGAGACEVMLVQKVEVE